MGIRRNRREGLFARFVAGESEQNRSDVIGALSKILRDLTCFDAAQRHVDDDAIGMEALGTDPCLESRCRRLDPEIIVLAKMFLSAASVLRPFGS